MALKVKGIVDGGMHAEEALGGSGRLEALHFTLAPSKNFPLGRAHRSTA
jgi:hypothetical protein